MRRGHRLLYRADYLIWLLVAAASMQFRLCSSFYNHASSRERDCVPVSRARIQTSLFESAEESFMHWASAKGISAPKLALHSFDGGLRGIIANEDIAADEVFLTIPLDVCFVASRPDNGDRDEEEEEVASWPIELAVQIAREIRTGEASSFAPWMALLPSREDFRALLPVHWHESILEYLDNDEVSYEAQKMRRLRDFLLLEEFRAFRHDDERSVLDYALDIVQTRNCGSDSLNVVAPMFDMLNHDANIVSNFRIDRQKGVLELMCFDRGFKKGEQVCINYRPKSIAACISNYGFFDTSRLDDVAIEYRLPRKVTTKFLLAGETSACMKLIQQEGLSLTSPYYISADGNVPSQLLRVLELVSMSDDACQGEGRDVGEGNAKNKALHKFMSLELQISRDALRLLLLEEEDSEGSETSETDTTMRSVKRIKAGILDHRISVLQKTLEKTMCFFRLVG